MQEAPRAIKAKYMERFPEFQEFQSKRKDSAIEGNDQDEVDI